MPNELDFNEDVQIGLQLPLGTHQNGVFKQTQTLLEQTKSNIKNLLLRLNLKLNVKNLPRHPNVKLENGIKKCKLGVSIKQSGSLQQTTVRTEVWNLRYLLKTT